MSLEQWCRNGWLYRDEITVAEVQQLFEVVDREIADALVEGLSADGRFQHAYDAALQLCMIALRGSGFRVRKGEGHHKRGIESLQYTLGEHSRQTAEHVERSSRLRAQATYERIGAVSEQDASDLVRVAQRLRADVLQWLRSQHAELVPPSF